MVFNYELVVSAVSEAAERVFGPEQDLLGRRVNEVLMSPIGDAQLAAQVARAGQRACEPVILPVRGVAPETARPARWPPASPPAARPARRS